MLLEAVALHVGIPTLDLVKHPEESQGCGSEPEECGKQVRLEGEGPEGRLVPLTLSAREHALALHTPWRLRSALGSCTWAGVKDRLSPVTLGLYL